MAFYRVRLIFETSLLALGLHSLLIDGVLGDLFPAVVRPDLEADPSPLSSADFKSGWSRTSTPPYALLARIGTNLHLSNRVREMGIYRQVRC